MTPRTLNNGYRGNNGNIYNMIFLSLIIHLFIITVVLISIPTTSRRLTFGTAYSVQLVGPEVILPSKDSSLLNNILKQSDEASSIILKRGITSHATTPLKKEETNKLNIEKAVRDIKQKGLTKSETTAAVAPAFARARMSESEVNTRMSEYTGFVWSRIKGNWTMPTTLMPKENVETIIDVKILRNGTVEQIDFEKRSGNRYFDDSALKAVKKSTPFPPFPDWIMDKYIEIGIRFHSAELH